MRVVILGGGESGVGAAYLAKAKGFDVFLSDMGTIRENYKKNWTSLGLNMKTDTHRRKILNADWVIKSPGIPKKAEMVQKIQEKGIRLSSEIEFASEFTNAKSLPSQEVMEKRRQRL
jgi:UDP-N-acetylmuramoylalanine--D-glutamate ligase